MEADELALWQEAADSVYLEREARPCIDCPMAFMLEMRAEGRCNRDVDTGPAEA